MIEHSTVQRTVQSADWISHCKAGQNSNQAKPCQAGNVVQVQHCARTSNSPKYLGELNSAQGALCQDCLVGSWELGVVEGAKEKNDPPELQRNPHSYKNLSG